uniref:Nucleotide-diphospho-sugar transferase domain-containing protein n=1 Tax=Entomoneis paludosa TaxID=265537 RepID=A0A7S2YJE8_9STRA
MVQITRTTRAGRSSSSRVSKEPGLPFFLRVIGNLFYVSGFLVCYLLVASLFDEVDETDYHGELSASGSNALVTKPNIRQAVAARSAIDQQDERAKTKIAYVISLTSCGAAYNQTTSDPNAKVFMVAEGAAVLAHSIHRASVHGELGGRYDYELVALHHPDATPCLGVLEQLGYRLIERKVFVSVEEIEGDYLREKIRSSGCCGDAELIKFEAYTLMEYPLALILDLDCLIMRPLDHLFDLMLHGIVPPREHLMWPDQPLPSEINFIYTQDYAMVSPQRPVTPVQGGFLLLRPNLQVYEDFKAMAKKGDFRDKGGWGGKTGRFWGSHTVQGMLPYYYLVLNGGNKSTAVEANRCIYNNMVAPSRAGSNAKFRCYVKEEPCRDCQIQPVEDIYSTHFTNCQKPWLCERHNFHTNSSYLCRSLHHEWFNIRSQMEISWGRSGTGSAPEWPDRDMFHGYCASRGSRGYESIATPYGTETSL